jgi:hypothetical protein
MIFQLVENPLIEFRYLSFIVFVLGVVSSSIFIFSINEPKLA